MDLDLLKKKLMYGSFLGMAISSRFLLGFQEGVMANVVSFILMFSMFSAVIYWLRIFRKELPEQKFTFKQVVANCFQLFLIAAVFSSLVKYMYFTYMKPYVFLEISAQALEMLKDIPDYPQTMIDQASELLTPFVAALSSGIFNALLGLLMGLLVWPVFKKEQEILSKK